MIWFARIATALCQISLVQLKAEEDHGLMNQNVALQAVMEILIQKNPGSYTGNQKDMAVCYVLPVTAARMQFIQQPNDNLQSIRVQGHAGVIDDCMVCHSTPPTGPGPHGITYVGIVQLNEELPASFILYQNYPNPFNPETVIKFSIPEKTFVTMKVYDALGREVESLVNSNVTPGVYTVKWNAEKVNSGIYFYMLKTEKTLLSRKMIVLK